MKRIGDRALERWRMEHLHEIANAEQRQGLDAEG